MALALVTNNAALRAAAAASGVNRDMETSMARLSSGKRINSASDDAAGVAISSRLTAEIRGTNQAVRNALDGQALLDTAEGAHKEVENILQRMREITVQAANDTNNQQDRDNLQAELNALSTEINRIASTTAWAGTGLLSGNGSGGLGTSTDFSFQVGANTSEADRISVQINAMSAEALGFDSNAAVAAVPQIGGEAQAVTISAGANSTASGSTVSLDSTTVTSGGEAQAVNITGSTNSTAAGSVFSLDTQTVTSGGDSQAVAIADGKQTTTAGNVISIDKEIVSGFVINGVSAADTSGWSVSGAGDVNGDGLDDLIVGAHRDSPNAISSGASTVVFGKADGTAVELSDIESSSNSGGFVINGASYGDQSGLSVSGAGDVNGDGLADLIVGARNDSPNGVVSGASTVVFGKADGTAVELSDIETSSNTGGFVINGVSAFDFSGNSVSGAGDVNGDGLADLIVGAHRDDSNGRDSGASTVVFGKADGTAVELSDIESSSNSGGFVINGVSVFDYAGLAVSGAGDVNGDGLADLIVGAPYDDPNGTDSGASTVVFGKADGTAVELSDIESSSNSGGFVINGVSAEDYSGWSVSGAGDVNGDGLADLIVGALGDDPNGSTVVFGKADGTAVELSDIESSSNSGGFVINGVSAEDYSGKSVSGAGDVNGDGLADLIVGAYQDDPNGSDSGASTVVFGKADGTAVELSDIESSSNSGGFVINGVSAEDYSGYSVSGAGDVNGDGLADLIVGAYGDDPNGDRSGASTVVFGKADGTAVELSDIEAGTGTEAALASDVSFGVGGKTLTVDLSPHHDGSNNDYYAAAEAIASAINNDSDLQALDYSAVPATVAEVNAGTYAAGDIIITRADTPATTITTLVGNAASFVVEGITVNTDLSAYSANLSGAAAAVASDINANTDLQALDYSAVADGGTPGDIIISRADTATNSSTTLAGNSVSVVIEGVTVTTDVTAYTSDISGAASAVAAAINAEGSLQALDYNATVDTSNPGDIIISRANTPITQPYVPAIPATIAMSLTSGDSARTATAKIDTAIKTVNIQRSKLGAVSNRLSHTVNNLTNISSNLSAARGGIEDADFAKETTDLAKNQILQQASTAMLAQANASKQNVLSLLQG